MSADTFTTAIFLITAVVASAVLVNAVFPVVYNMAGTFSSATHDSDERLRTDFKIVAYHYSSSANTAEIWMKNIGSANIPIADIVKSDVMFGPETSYGRLSYTTDTTPSSGHWTTEFVNDAPTKVYDLNGNGNWDRGETLHIIAHPAASTGSGENVYFQFILPGGTWRSQTFTAS